MTFIEYIKVPGEHSFMLTGAIGPLEAVLTVPENSRSGIIAFLGHPHPLQGGTMNNKVVTTLARTFKELGIPSLRFNFRGVGASAGVFDEGIGESEDLLTLIHQAQKEIASLKIILAGFSFGSFVTFRAAIKINPLVLISIAPPVDRYDYKSDPVSTYPWLIVQGDTDEVVSYTSLIQFIQQLDPAPDLIEFAQTGHFFHGKLIELREKLLSYLKNQVGL